MQPLQITFRNVPSSRSIERLVRQKAQRLEKLHDHIVKCHVTLGTQNQRPQKGNLYDVHLDIHIPGKSFAVSSAQDDDNAHELLSKAIRDAFDAAERQLRSYKGSRQHRHP